MRGPLRFTVEDGVAWLVLDRPEAGNAVDDLLRTALLGALGRVGGEPHIRAAVLTGTGACFSQGADVGGAGAPGVARMRRGARHDARELVRALLELDKPLVAAVNGDAVGLGAHLALACDLVVMAEEARFAAVFARRGVGIDAAGAYLLSRLVGVLKANELVLLGADVGAQEALHFGLCNRVVPRSGLEAAAREWAARLAEGPTFALGITKRLLRRAYESDLETAFEEEALARSIVALAEPAPPGPTLVRRR